MKSGNALMRIAILSIFLGKPCLLHHRTSANYHLDTSPNLHTQTGAYKPASAWKKSAGPAIAARPIRSKAHA